MQTLQINKASKKDWEQVWYLLQNRGAVDDEEKAAKRFFAYIEYEYHYYSSCAYGKQGGWLLMGTKLRTTFVDWKIAASLP